MPKYEEDKAKAEQDIANREAMIERIGKRTGYDPTTGKETSDRELHRIQVEGLNESRRATADYRKQQAETHVLDIQERVRHNKATEGEKQLNDYMLRFPGKAITKEIAEAAGRPFLEGYVPTAKPEKPEAPWGHGVDEQGVWTGGYDAQGNRIVTRPQGGGSVQPAGQVETASQTRVREQAAQRDITKFHDLGNKINYWAEKRGNRAKAAQAEKDPAKKAQLEASYQQAEAEQNKAEQDWAAARDALKSHGGLVKLNPEGTKAELVRGSVQAAQTITKTEYDAQVQKHGQAKVDDWLKNKGISVQ